jgi:hypothetical protein
MPPTTRIAGCAAAAAGSSAMVSRWIGWPPTLVARIRDPTRSGHEA